MFGAEKTNQIVLYQKMFTFFVTIRMGHYMSITSYSFYATDQFRSDMTIWFYSLGGIA